MPASQVEPRGSARPWSVDVAHDCAAPSRSKEVMVSAVVSATRFSTPLAAKPRADPLPGRRPRASPIGRSGEFWSRIRSQGDQARVCGSCRSWVVDTAGAVTVTLAYDPPASRTKPLTRVCSPRDRPRRGRLDCGHGVPAHHASSQHQVTAQSPLRCQSNPSLRMPYVPCEHVSQAEHPGTTSDHCWPGSSCRLTTTHQRLGWCHRRSTRRADTSAPPRRTRPQQGLGVHIRNQWKDHDNPDAHRSSR